MSEIRPLSRTLQEKARRDLNEDPEHRDEDVTHIRDWLNNQPHIIANYPNDQILIAFLRSCKFDLALTKETIDLYYTLRTTLPEFFKDRDIRLEKLREIMQLGIYLPLPGTDDKGRKIYIMRPGLRDPGKISVEDQFKVQFMLLDWMIREDDDFVVSGFVGVMDMSHMTLRHGLQMSSIIKNVMSCVQDAFPVQPREINFLHTPAIFGMIFQLFKTFAKDEIKEKCFVHGSDFESFYKHVPQHLLPMEYGGEAGSIQDIIDTYIQRLEEYREFFLEDEKCGVDESKRPERIQKSGWGTFKTKFFGWGG